MGSDLIQNLLTTAMKPLRYGTPVSLAPIFQMHVEMCYVYEGAAAARMTDQGSLSLDSGADK